MEVLAKETMEKLQKQLTPEIMGALAVSLVTGALLMFLLLRSQVVSLKKSLENQQVNPGVDKENPKVVHTCKVADMEDTDKLVYCRCWRSKKFPYCDGSHVSFNKCSKDNVGPLIVQK